jgi:membrane protein DedA with SNARE-associated domain
MAVCDWNVKKCALYLITGAMAKATVVTVLSWLSYDNFRKEVAPWVALGAVAAVMVVSIVASLIYKKKIGLRGGPARSQS